MPPHTITGHVYDAWIRYSIGEDRPIPGATVGCGVETVGVSPEDGSFSVPVSSDDAIVTAKAPDYVSVEKLMPASGEGLCFRLWPISLYGTGRCTSRW